MGLIEIRGRNGTGSTSAVDAWAQNIAKTHITTPVRFGFSSSAAADAAAGTGARTILVVMLDSAGKVQSETITLNGQTKVDSSILLAYRILHMEVLTAGSGGVSAGEIYAYDNSDTVTAGVPQTAAKIQGRIATGMTESNGGHYTIPAGHVGAIKAILASFPDITTTAKYGYVEIQYKPYLGTLWKRWHQFGLSSAGAQTFGYLEAFDETFPPLTDIRIQYRQSAACEVYVHLDLLISPV